MNIYFEYNRHVDLFGKPENINIIKVVGHAETTQQCVAISAIMQTTAIFMMSKGYDGYDRSHEQHSDDPLVSMTFGNLDVIIKSTPNRVMLEYLMDSLIMLAGEFGINIIEVTKDYHDFKNRE